MIGADLCDVHGRPDATERLRVIPDDRRCTATRYETGERCKAWALSFQTVCKSHGGKARQSLAAAQRRREAVEVEQKARKLFAKISPKPVDNPLAALQQVAGELVAFKDVLAGMVGDLEEIRYQAGSGEQIRGELTAYQAALRDTVAALAVIGRLNIDERLAAISEKQAEAVVSAIEAALTHAGVTGEARSRAKQVAARRLRAL